MGHGERGVKWLDSECLDVFLESLGRHQREGAEGTNVAIVEGASVIESEVHGRVCRLALRERPGGEEKRAGEAWLHDDPVAGGEIEHDHLRPAPASQYQCAGHATP